MVNHGLAAKLTETDLLLLRSLGRLFSYKEIISSLSARSFCNVTLTLFQGNRILTGVMHVQLYNTKHNLYRGYYTVARRYEFYFRVAKQYFTNERSE